NTTNEQVLEAARAEIRRSWKITCELNKDHPQAAELFNPEKMPGLHDPFAGGGSIPLEAQRLGLEAYASDLNPIAVLINKAMIEIPPRFAGHVPVHPGARNDKALFNMQWKGAVGLAEDVRRYGQWMRDEAQRRIGALYPPVTITTTMAASRSDLKEYVGQKLTVIAWIWARTVKSPNPAFGHVDVPLASTFVLSTKEGKEAYVQPVLRDAGYEFAVRCGRIPQEAFLGTSAGKRKGFRCLMSDSPMGYDYIRGEGKAGRMGARLMAIVAEGPRGRVYLPPDSAHEQVARTAKPQWRPDGKMPKKHRNFQPPVYGMDSFGDIFTDRQLVALTTFGDLVGEVRVVIRRDAVTAGISDSDESLERGGSGARAYSEAVSVYLHFAVDKAANYWSSLCSWHSGRDTITSTFGRQALPMVWDHAEANPLSGSSGNLIAGVEQCAKFLLNTSPSIAGFASQADAQTQSISVGKVVSTDPPYYDNIAYADLSDYFYAWTRRSLRAVFPLLLSTIAVPKEEELVASLHRHGSKEKRSTSSLLA
ncbi:MAG: DUF1156 domain-containing protein, partial [Fimbriimonadaceae bacterium]|nr:DUF1156 domain-containing protein [Fimbriimonadaceae bacterium]